MAKYLKLQSLILCVCLMLTAFSGISALAADPFALIGFDADSDFIVLDFNQAIDTANADITLTHNGEEVDFTLAHSIYNSYTQGTGSEVYTYTITPQDDGGNAVGISLGDENVYVLTITEIKNSDASETVAGISKRFFVNDIGGVLKPLRTTLSGKTTSEEEVTPGSGIWQSNITKTTTTYSEKNVSYFATGVGADYLNPNFTPLNNCDHTLSTKSSSTEPVTEMDYTIKVTFSDVTNLGHSHFGIAITDNVNRFFSVNSNSFQGLSFHLQRQNNTQSTHAFLNEKHAKAAASRTTKTLNASATLANVNFTSSTGFEMKLASRDGRAHAYINNKKVADVALTREYRGYAYVEVEGIRWADGTMSTTQTGSVKVSKFLATRCYELYNAEIDKTANVAIDDTLTVTLERAITPESASAIKLLTEEGAVDADKYSVALNSDGTVATITLNGLDYRTDYKVSFDGVEFLVPARYTVFNSLEFTTCLPATELYSFGTAGDAPFEGTVTLEAVIANNTQAEPLSFTATIAIYNSLGQMVKVDGITTSLAEGEDVTVSIEDFVCDPEETYTAKCFVWDSFTSMNKIFEGIIE